MKLTLMQLVFGVIIILCIAFVVLKFYNPKPFKSQLPDDPKVSVPFQEIKVKMK